MAESTYQARRERLLGLLEERQTSAAAFSHLPNIRYLTGFSGSSAVVVLSDKDTVLYTDPRYELQAAQETGCKVRVVRGPLWPEVARSVRRRRVTSLGLEAELLAQAEYARIGEQLGPGVRLCDVSGLAEQLRVVKDEGEIEAIRRSMDICGRAYLQTLGKIRVGMTETGIAAELEYRMRRLGAERPAFETIVAAGARSALPHAQPTGSRVQANQLVLVDMGASLEGYASDMTRVMHTGRPTAQTKRLYAAVLEAQLAAVDAVRPGATCPSIDRAARKTLQRHGYGEFFVHSTGHGLGLEIHEAPRIGRRVKEVLEQNMVITIEPGAYIPGKGGVRIEDTVLVTERGAEVLTAVPKELLVL
ncbi:MAG: Xaa-Pro peptidase family protein [Bryobacteraceae bacterium]